MPTYHYEAMDAQGQEVKDEIEALSSEEAISKIRNLGFFPTKIKEKGARRRAKPGDGKAKAGPQRVRGTRGKVKTKILPNSAAECAALLAWAQRHSGGEIEQLHFIADGAKQALKGEMIYVTNELYTIPIGIENFWKTNKEGPELL